MTATIAFQNECLQEMQSSWVLEHRLVMQKKIGRVLEPFENVHHKDGDRLNNHPTNLELWITRQPRGQRPKDLVKWARWILEKYDLKS